MFTKRFMHFLTKYNKNSNNYHQIKQRGPTGGFGDSGRRVIYYQGAGEH